MACPVPGAWGAWCGGAWRGVRPAWRLLDGEQGGSCGRCRAWFGPWQRASRGAVMSPRRESALCGISLAFWACTPRFAMKGCEQEPGVSWAKTPRSPAPSLSAEQAPGSPPLPLNTVGLSQGDVSPQDEEGISGAGRADAQAKQAKEPAPAAARFVPFSGGGRRLGGPSGSARSLTSPSANLPKSFSSPGGPSKPKKSRPGQEPQSEPEAVRSLGAAGGWAPARLVWEAMVLVVFSLKLISLRPRFNVQSDGFGPTRAPGTLSQSGDPPAWWPLRPCVSGLPTLPPSVPGRPRPGPHLCLAAARRWPPRPAAARGGAGRACLLRRVRRVQFRAEPLLSRPCVAGTHLAPMTCVPFSFTVGESEHVRRGLAPVACGQSTRGCCGALAHPPAFLSLLGPLSFSQAASWGEGGAGRLGLALPLLGEPRLVCPC